MSPPNTSTLSTSKKEALNNVYVVRQCIVVLLWRLFWVKLFFWITGFAVYHLPSLWPALQSLIEPRIYTWIHIVLASIEMLVMGYYILSWNRQYYLITPDKIISNQGVIAKKQEICAIKNIESVDLNQSVIGRIFCFGTIKLFAPTLNHTLHMDNIHRPQKKMTIIEHLLPNTTSRANNTQQDLLIIPKGSKQYAS